METKVSIPVRREYLNKRVCLKEANRPYQHVVHSFGPLYKAGSGILILGSIPSPASRAVGFYYGHPRNRFWQVLADVYGVSLPETIEEAENMQR